jgi:transglutaminase-like putative cysteine protease
VGGGGVSRVRSASTDGRGRAAALVVLAFASAAGWWSVFGTDLLWATPVVVGAVLVTLRVLPGRVAAGLLLAWIPGALLLAGVPASGLRPGAWDESGRELLRGLDALTVPDRGTVGPDPWPLAGALLTAGIAWGAAGLVSTVRLRVAALLAFVLPALPLVWAIALEQTPDAAWPGAALVAAGVLWAARGRLLALVPATAAIALLAVVGAQAIGPREQWIPFVDAPGRKPAFTRLDTTQTYGPLNDRRTGATMLKIRSAEPALWRMQTLERYNGRWGLKFPTGSELPQPAAVATTSEVEVVGLRNRLVAAPGRITSISGGGGSYPDRGEARQIKRAPDSGDTYRVTSQVVRATAEELQDVKIPAPFEYEEYTRTTPRPGYGRRYDGTRRRFDGTGSYGGPTDEQLERFRGYGFGRTSEVREIAERLARGTTSQLEVVRRVQSYLVDSGRFRYTLDVPEAGAQPIVDFLLETREGYCQQFAGAAALLLRMANVPTRVVTGFATGTEDDDGRYVVRDEDAHAWIEVYFPEFGWVPFNPTPAAAEATVAAEVDLLTPPEAAGAGGAGGGSGLLLIPAAALLALGGALAMRRRQRRDVPPAVPVGELLARLVPGPVGPATTLTALAPRLREIGPSTAALAARVEKDRFSGGDRPVERHPRLRVWRALRRDVGPARATVLMVRHAGPSPGTDDPDAFRAPGVVAPR